MREVKQDGLRSLVCSSVLARWRFWKIMFIKALMLLCLRWGRKEVWTESENHHYSTVFAVSSITLTVTPFHMSFQSFDFPSSFRYLPSYFPLFYHTFHYFFLHSFSYFSLSPFLCALHHSIHYPLPYLLPSFLSFLPSLPNFLIFSLIPSFFLPSFRHSIIPLIIFKWWAAYLESVDRLDKAKRYYKKAGDHLALVRICCFQVRA